MDIKVASPTVEVVAYKREEAPASGNAKRGKPGHLRSLRSFVCEQQAEIAQGIFLSLEHHKRFKEAYDDGDLPLARTHLTALIRVLDQHLKRSWGKCISFADKFFADNQPTFQTLPRACLKGTKPGSNGTLIADIYRGTSAKRSDIEYRVSDNTAFASVRESGTFYRCNDIPTEVRKGLYKNPRVDIVKAVAFASVNHLTRYIRQKRELCEPWNRCWHDYKEKAQCSSYYRSTLVIPLTLVNNDGIDKEFDDFTIVGISRTAEKTTYAFLCFDHPAVNYFTEDAIDAGYILADLLSFQLMTRQTLLQDSSTVKRFQETTGFAFESLF